MIIELENIGYNFDNINNIHILAAHNKDINVLSYFCEIKKYELNIEMYYYAIANNNINIIKYLINHNCIYDSGVYCIAIQYNRLNLIKYFDRMNLITKPYDLGVIMCNIAIRYQYFKCLKYLYKMGYSWKNIDGIILSYKMAIKYNKNNIILSGDITKKHYDDFYYLYKLCDKYTIIFSNMNKNRHLQRSQSIYLVD